MREQFHCGTDPLDRRERCGSIVVDLTTEADLSRGDDLARWSFVRNNQRSICEAILHLFRDAFCSAAERIHTQNAFRSAWPHEAYASSISMHT